MKSSTLAILLGGVALVALTVYATKKADTYFNGDSNNQGFDITAPSNENNNITNWIPNWLKDLVTNSNPITYAYKNWW